MKIEEISGPPMDDNHVYLDVFMKLSAGNREERGCNDGILEKRITIILFIKNEHDLWISRVRC